VVSIGIVYPEHTVPLGASLIHLRYCNTCGRSFGSVNGDRHCRPCHANPQPLGKNVVLAILENLMHAEHPLPL
jgi:hypothetical protein